MLHPQRAECIGGSESYDVLIGDAMKVFCRKTGILEEESSEGKEWLKWGHVLEPVIAREFSERHNWALEEPGFLRYESAPWFGGTPDRIITEKNIWAGLEIKTSGAFYKEDWGEQGTDEIPHRYIIQCQHYMKLLGYPKWYLAVLIGGQEYREYLLEEDKQLQEEIFDACRDFWHEHVLKKIPPEITGSIASKNYLHERYPKEKKALRQATEKEIELLNCLKRAKKEEKLFSELISELTNKVKFMIGDAEGIAWNDGEITWKKTKDSLYTDWQGMCKEFAAIYPEKYRDLFSRHTEEKEGVRRFLPKFRD